MCSTYMKQFVDSSSFLVGQMVLTVPLPSLMCQDIFVDYRSGVSGGRLRDGSLEPGGVRFRSGPVAGVTGESDCQARSSKG
jgi:hypothetical protein